MPRLITRFGVSANRFSHVRIYLPYGKDAMLWVVYTDNEHLYTDCKSQSEKRDVFYLRTKQALFSVRMRHDREPDLIIGFLKKPRCGGECLCANLGNAFCPLAS